jgi:hypothetical protein
MEADELKPALPDLPEASILWRRRLIQAVEIKSAESPESHKAGFPTFPYSVEISSGLPHSQGLDDEIRYLEATAETNEQAQIKPAAPQGSRNGCPRSKV